MAVYWPGPRPGIFLGQRGELRRNYGEGMKDQLGALRLALNAVVLWKSLYLEGRSSSPPLAASPAPTTCWLACHRCSSTTSTSWAAMLFRPQEAGRRPLREPSTGGEDDGE
ncbi:Tn3 family transposase [Streptomyces populi]